MKKLKPKLSAPQKRRHKEQQKKKVLRRQSERQKGNWVEDCMDWIPVQEFHRALADSSEDQNDNDINSIEHQKTNCVEDSLEEDGVTNSSVSLKIISWNVLAYSYCNRSSHQNLPPKYQRVVFDRKKRPLIVQKTLQQLTEVLQPDFWALQEVDPPLGVAKLMTKAGYGVVETDSCKDGRVGRVDSCGLYYDKQKWICLEHKTVHLDDLAILQSGRVETPNESIRKIFKRSSSSLPHDSKNNTHKMYTNNLQGLQCSFVRKNVALLVRLEHLDSKHQVVVAVAHLFWNPAYEYVKLCQIHFVTQQIKAFCKGNEPVVLCGDFNSQPGSTVHQYLTKGKINAKRVAPWYALSRKASRLPDHEIKAAGNDDAQRAASHQGGEPPVLDNDLAKGLEQLQLSEDGEEPVSVKYMLDFTLNKFCRWMRILGLDAALETEEEEQERTKNGNMVIFNRCVQEGRTLVTTSTRVIQRKDCPPGSYLLDTKSLLNLEQTLVHLLLSHGVKLEPNEMLSRCVVCNGNIDEVLDDHEKKQIFQNHQAPEEVHDDVLGVYQCDNCKQGYWWCEKPNSSASRVKSQATKLLELCIRGGVPVGEDFGMFGFVDVEKIRKEGSDQTNYSAHLMHHLDVVKWLQDENLTNPLEQMASAYATPDSGAESLPFTNVTSGFVGHLDYIMYGKGALNVTDLLYVPRSYEELNNLGISDGHLLPSCRWPSDHLAIGCSLELTQNEKTETVWPEPPPGSADLYCGVINGSLAPVTKHGERCACGCVPAIPSLFEMAELRKQARLRQETR
ncbi:Mut7-C RNAse domain containing protein [Nitzschia inconspicua]|uniref:Mut7-C RNAse domain containing protein n=1 Tax=Nitzschia inconspicua TaxID=303405 RepID=A0A9K3Q2N7_9STRA|nr:Mut7-C RNAse domain containing protein [Nitzschia inconspicua]